MKSLTEPLAEQLPYWEFAENHLILSDGSISKAIEVIPLDIEGFDNSKINNLIMSLRTLINSLPERVSLQFQVETSSDFYDMLSSHEALRTSRNDFLVSMDSKRCSSIRMEMETGRLLRKRLFINAVISPQLKHNPFSLKSTVKFSNELSANHLQMKDEVLDCVSLVTGQLSQIGFKTRDLVESDYIRVIYKYLNPNRCVISDQPFVGKFFDEKLRGASSGVQSPRSQIVFGDLILDKSDFILDGARTRIFTLKNLPETTFAGMMENFLSFPFYFDLILSLRMSDQSKEMSKLQQKRRMAHSLSQTKSGQLSDLESQSKLNASEDLIKEIIDTGQKICMLQLVICVRADDTSNGLKDLNQMTREILAKFRSLSGSEGVHETVGAWPIFKGSLPFAPVNFERGRMMKTNNVVDFLPMFGSRLGDDRPLTLVHNRLKSLVSLDAWDKSLSNYNSLVTGASGAGKSFFNNYLLLQQLARGVKAFIIDIGGSYKKLTELLKGEYYEINLSDNYAINPFHIRDVDIGPSSEKIKALTSVVELMVSEDGSKLSKFERVLLEKIIKEVYEKCKTEVKVPILSDLERACLESKEPDLVRIGKLLFSWVGDSPFGKLLDKHSEFKSTASITAFDLKGLSQYPDLQSVMILIITNYILDDVERDRTCPKRVILDEAWELLQSASAARFMEYAARTFRKTGSGITFITQGLDDIVKSTIGNAILNNTSTKMIMFQKSDVKPLATTLKLNSREVTLIESLKQIKGEYSEGFLMEGDNRQVIRIYPTPLDYWISTSDANDNRVLEQFRSLGDSLEESILKAAEQFPFGNANSNAGIRT